MITLLLFAAMFQRSLTEFTVPDNDGTCVAACYLNGATVTCPENVHMCVGAREIDKLKPACSGCRFLPAVEDPPDVPAIQEKRVKQTCLRFNTDPCGMKRQEEVTSWTCADKSRVLLTAEDGKRWCHKVIP